MTKFFKQKKYTSYETEKINGIFKDNEGNWSDNILEDNEQNVIQLGIYALPGTEFIINQSNISSGARPLIINSAGIFQINIENNPITDIKISKNSLSLNNQCIILDLVIEGGLLNA